MPALDHRSNSLPLGYQACTGQFDMAVSDLRLQNLAATRLKVYLVNLSNISNTKFPSCVISNFRIRIRSRMWDACLVIDGGVSFKFNDGAVATFEIAKDNAVRTIHLD